MNYSKKHLKHITYATNFKHKFVIATYKEMICAYRDYQTVEKYYKRRSKR